MGSRVHIMPPDKAIESFSISTDRLTFLPPSKPLEPNIKKVRFEFEFGRPSFSPDTYLRRVDGHPGSTCDELSDLVPTLD